ncbi:YibE/F family protein [Clostridium cellulovorans 743B]|uniref:YibE/F family protein n=1 Tax=Clostridium cellulovorans (strain ATCC 35296 / DSM 3052 / OCM 3 / 743B) TaxID=573061 RepID=D9SQL6_CLOC7|nr:YibE/F family protein [Clostridium cellulovorans 743B]
MKLLKLPKKKEIIFILVFLIILTILIFIPTGFEKQIYVNSEGVRGKILSVDNSGMYKTGLITQGEQRCEILIKDGIHKGEQTSGINLLSGKLEYDKVFTPGDIAWVLLERNANNNIVFANLIDHYRISKELILLGVFAIIIIAFLGFTGARTLLSLSLAFMSIWKILIPSMLNGINPILIALLVGNCITITTLLLVAGFSKKAYCAIAGSVVCSLITCFFAIIFGELFNINGAIMQWSESLLYAGYENLNLTAIFQAGIYLACSGAVMDLAIDISAALDEIVRNSPNISKKELIFSGLTIGKAVVGSQTSTLLLAYMGSYISVMMVYMAQGTPMINIFTSKTIASEILHTFVGCIGLVLVSPLTSLICGFAYKKDIATEPKVDLSNI